MQSALRAASGRASSWLRSCPGSPLSRAGRWMSPPRHALRVGKRRPEYPPGIPTAAIRALARPQAVSFVGLAFGQWDAQQYAEPVNNVHNTYCWASHCPNARLMNDTARAFASGPRLPRSVFQDIPGPAVRPRVGRAGGRHTSSGPPANAEGARNRIVARTKTGRNAARSADGISSSSTSDKVSDSLDQRRVGATGPAMPMTLEPAEQAQVVRFVDGLFRPGRPRSSNSPCPSPTVVDSPTDWMRQHEDVVAADREARQVAQHGGAPLEPLDSCFGDALDHFDALPPEDLPFNASSTRMRRCADGNIAAAG